MTVAPFVRKVADSATRSSRGKITKDRAKELVASGVMRAVRLRGKQVVAVESGCSPRCIEKALSLDTLPSVETLVNMLDAEVTALDELFAAKGWKIVPLDCDAGRDLNAAAGVMDAMAALIRANADGSRDHNETLAVAAILRPHLPTMNAIVSEADSLRGM